MPRIIQLVEGRVLVIFASIDYVPQDVWQSGEQMPQPSASE